MFTATYLISYTDTVMAIGCEQHSITDWFNFDDKRIQSMDVDALQFWNKNKVILNQIVKGSI